MRTFLYLFLIGSASIVLVSPGYSEDPPEGVIQLNEEEVKSLEDNLGTDPLANEEWDEANGRHAIADAACYIEYGECKRRARATYDSAREQCLDMGGGRYQRGCIIKRGTRVYTYHDVKYQEDLKACQKDYYECLRTKNLME